MRITTTLGLIVALWATAWASASLAQQSLEKLESIFDEEAAAEPSPEPAAPETTQPPPPAAKPIVDPPPGYLGLYAIEVDGRLLVESVRPRSPAEAAAIRPGDQILRIGGAPLATLDEMSQVLADLPAGTRLSLLVKRHGRDLPLVAILGERQPTPAPEPARDSLAALDELGRLLDATPPADDAPAKPDKSRVLKRMATLEAELKLLHARIGVLERALERVEAAADE